MLLNVPVKVCARHMIHQLFSKFIFTLLAIADWTDSSDIGGWDRTTEAISPDIVLQIEQAFDNVDRTLKVACSKGWPDVFSIRSYHVVLDETIMEAMVRCLKKYCPDHQPIWTCLGVTRLGFDDMKVEIEVKAHASEDKKA